MNTGNAIRFRHISTAKVFSRLLDQYVKPLSVDNSNMFNGIVYLDKIHVDDVIEYVADCRRKLLVALRSSGAKHDDYAELIIEYQRIERDLILSDMKSAFLPESLINDEIALDQYKRYSDILRAVCRGAVESNTGIQVKSQDNDSFGIMDYLIERVFAYNEIPAIIRRNAIIEKLDASHRLDVLTYSGRYRGYISNETLNRMGLRSRNQKTLPRQISHKIIKRDNAPAKIELIALKFSLFDKVRIIAETGAKLMQDHIMPLDRVDDVYRAEIKEINAQRKRLCSKIMRMVETKPYDCAVTKDVDNRIDQWIRDRKSESKQAARDKADKEIQAEISISRRKARQIVNDSRNSMMLALQSTRAR